MIELNKVFALRRLFEGVGAVELRELCLLALRQWHSERPNQRQFTRHGELGRILITMLAQRPGAPAWESGWTNLNDYFLEIDTSDELSGVADFLDWFVRAGFARALGAQPNKYPISYQLTQSGAALLANPNDHPLLPGAVERMRARCAGLPDGVIVLFNDSHACFERMLLRPAVTVLGVAYEVAIEGVVESLIARSALQAGVLDLGAASRIARVRDQIDTLQPGRDRIDERTATHQAFVFADQLRRRRNDAAHTRPRFGFEDRGEVEELIVSAGRHLPALWSLYSP